MGVFIGVLVLLFALALVVLMAVSEWYDFDLGSSLSQAVSKALPPTPAVPKRAKAVRKARR
jgi:hypothetical protein